MNKKIILLGGGGHAKVILESLQAKSSQVAGIIAPRESDIAPSLQNYPWLGDDFALQQHYSSTDILLINGIGQVPGSTVRSRVYRFFKESGYIFEKIIHPTAILASDASLEEGVQMMAGVIVQPAARIGENTILNTRVSVDHDCVIGRDVHLSPGAILAGGVTVEDGVFIGAGAVVIEGIRIGRDSIIGAGAVVITDIPPYSRYAGVPAKEMHP